MQMTGQNAEALPPLPPLQPSLTIHHLTNLPQCSAMVTSPPPTLHSLNLLIDHGSLTSAVKNESDYVSLNVIYNVPSMSVNHRNERVRITYAFVWAEYRLHNLQLSAIAPR